MKTIITLMAVMLFSLCSFSAYSHPPDNETVYEVHRFRYADEDLSRVIVYSEGSYYYLHYHYNRGPLDSNTYAVSSEEYDFLRDITCNNYREYFSMIPVRCYFEIQNDRIRRY